MTPQYGTSLTGVDNVADICHIIRPDDKTRTLCGTKVAWRFGKGEGHAGWNLCIKCEAIAGPPIPATPAAYLYSYKVEIHTHADQPGVWTGNDLRFATEAEGEDYGRSLPTCQPPIVDWRVVKVDEAFTHSFNKERGLARLTEGPYYVGEAGGQQA